MLLFKKIHQLGMEALRDKRQLLRFFVVGIINTGFSYLIYACFLYIGLNFALANLMAVLVGILFSFRTQGTLVFFNANPNLFWKFAATWLLVYLVTISVIGFWLLYGLDAYWSGALALPVSVVLSFLLQKFFVFGDGLPS